MVQSFAAPPINPIISVTPLATAQAGRDAPEIPQPLANAANGTTVEGFVVNRDSQNNPILRTSLGDILIKSDFFLKTGSVIVFRVDNSHASRARIITIDGLTPTDYVAEHTRAPQTDSVRQSLLIPSKSNLDPASTDSFIEESAPLIVRAVVLKPSFVNKSPSAVSSTPSTAAIAPTAPLQAGTAIKIAIIKAELPQVLPPAITTPPQNIGNSATIVAPTIELPSPSLSTQAATTVNAKVAANAVQNTATNEPGNPLPSPRVPPTPAPIHQATSTTAVREPPVIIADEKVPSVIPQPTAAQSSRLEAQQVPQQPGQSIHINAVSPAASSASAPPATAHPQAPLPLLQAATYLAAVSESPDVIPSPLSNSLAASAVPQATASSASTIAAPTFSNAPFSALPAAAAISAYRSATHLSPAPIVQPLATTSPAATHAVTTNAPSGTVIANVIGHEVDGAMILQTPLGTLKTFLPQALPVGTQLAIQIQPAIASEVSAIPLLAGNESFSTVTSLAREWKSFDDALQWLQLADPQIFNQLAQQLPQAGPKLTSSLLFFIAAIRGGDVRNFLGARASQLLEQKASELMTQLRNDTAQWQQLSTETANKPWAMFTLPVMVDARAEPLRFYYRQEDQPEEAASDKKSGAQHRFIIDVDFSQLGAVQMDGFVRSDKDKKVFDLVFRSERALVTSVSDAIREIFKNALEATGYRGYMTFQQGQQHFVRPLAAIVPSSNDAQPILA